MEKNLIKNEVTESINTMVSEGVETFTDGVESRIANCSGTGIVIGIAIAGLAAGAYYGFKYLMKKKKAKEDVFDGEFEETEVDFKEEK